MKFATLLSFVFLFSSLALRAQSAGQEPLHSMEFHPPVAAIVCPLGLHAQHGTTGGLLQADQGRPKGIAQMLHLTLSNLSKNDKPIVSARVRVRGLSGKGRVTQALAGPGDAGRGNDEVVQTLDLKFSSSNGRQVSGDLLVPGITAALMIELNSVTYADGSTRSFSGLDACRVAPDPLMYIAGR